MIKLFTLKELSPFSSDAVYKICLSLEQYGLTDENMVSFDNYDDLFNDALSALENGDDIVIASENDSYNSIKRDLLGKLILDERSSPEIAEVIALNAGDDVAQIDMEAHCLVPYGSEVYISTDGLFSGFSLDFLNGRLVYIPLDFMRLDTILDSVCTKVFDAPTVQNEQPDENDNGEYEDESGYDISEPVSKMIYSLTQLDKTIALTTGEATMKIYNLYNRIEGLTDVVSFVEIADEVQKPVSEDGEDSQEADENYLDENGDDLTAEQPAKPEPTVESESVKIIRHAREAMYNCDTDFGGAISDIYSTQDDEGNVSYFVYVAVADRKTAKAKKINTSNPDDLILLLPHSVAVLCDTVSQKVDAVNKALATVFEGDEAQEKAPEKKISKGVFAFAIVMLAIAIIAPIIIVSSVFGNSNQPVTQPSSQVGIVTQDTSMTTTTPTSALFPGITDSATTAVGNTISVIDNENNLTPVEPGATDVSATATTTTVTSTSGTFTFYVFGYGHGVGMSQVGANYLASQGWNYAQILAHYYYGATLVAGDIYPETISYSGTAYKTREYLASSLESEMGSSFNAEALKAQAVAIYTFAKYNSFNVTSSANAYGKTPSAAAYAAVDAVMENGLYVAYNGQTALTMYHAISAGKTTSYYNYNSSAGTDLVYLRGGRPSYGDYLSSDYKTTYTISSADMKALIEKNAGTSVSGDPSTWITIISHDQAVREDIGYVSSINVGGKVISGNDFRINVMEGRIRSHCFALVYTPNSAT